MIFWGLLGTRIGFGASFIIATTYYCYYCFVKREAAVGDENSFLKNLVGYGVIECGASKIEASFFSLFNLSF
jgi:hypothetical protein